MMEISAGKNTTDDKQRIQREIKVKGRKLGTVVSFKYLGAVALDNSFKPVVLSRLAQATEALTNLKPILTDNNCLSDQR